MYAARKKLNSLSEVLQFTFPKLHTGGKWYVDFYAYDPEPIGGMFKPAPALVAELQGREPPRSCTWFR